MPLSANRTSDINIPLDSHALSAIQAISLLVKFHGLHIDKAQLTLAWLDISEAWLAETLPTINMATTTTSRTPLELTTTAPTTAVSKTAASTTTEAASDLKNLPAPLLTESISEASVLQAPKEIARRLQYTLDRLGFDARIEQGTTQKLIRASTPLIVIDKDGEPMVLEEIKHNHLLLIGSRKSPPVPISHFSSVFANVWVCAQLHTSAPTSG